MSDEVFGARWPFCRKWTWLVLALLVAASHGVLRAQGSRGNFPPPVQTVPGGKNDPFGDDRAALDERMEHSRERARQADRQKRMVDDANRLLALAVQYRTEVQTHGSPTPEDERLLAEMEKLARSVKDRMRGM